MSLPASYEEVFNRFDSAGGRWIATWNWAAFVFGVLWYLYRGMWAKAIIYLVVPVFISIITGGIAGIFFWVAYGLLANYDLYLLHRKGTQLWDGAGVAADAVPGVTGPASTAKFQSNANIRLTALENAKAQGVISDAEYQEKKQQVEKDIEREKKIIALEEMRRSGIISSMEYDAKKREIELETHT